MKNIFFIAFLLSCFLSIGQIRNNGDIELTPIIGSSSSNHTHSILFGSSHVSGIQLGVYGNYFFNNRWSLRSGLLYQKMGAEKLDFLFFKNDYSEVTNYLTLPLTISYHFGSIRNWYINYGVSLGILTNIKADYGDKNGFINIKNIANPAQFGINGGIGYKIMFSPKFIIILEASSMLGLTKTTKQNDGKNYYTSLNIGAVFRI